MVLALGMDGMLRMITTKRCGEAQADTVNRSVGNTRIIGSNGRDKLGSNLSIIVKILVMDSNHLTDMGDRNSRKMVALTRSSGYHSLS
jgi:hypothetical protein